MFPPRGGLALVLCLFDALFRSTDARATYEFLPAAVIRMLKQHYHMQEGSAADGGAVKDYPRNLQPAMKLQGLFNEPPRLGK